MERTFTRRLLVSALIAAGAIGVVPGCSSTPDIPPDKNPVSTPEVAPPPITGGTLHVTQSGLAVAADTDRDLVWLVDLGTQQVSKVVLQKGDEPGRVAEDADGHIHVALRGAGAVATIDVTTGKVTDRTTVCATPRGLAYDAAIDGIHVACATGDLVTLPAKGGKAIRSLRFPERDLRDVIVNGDKLFVTRFRSAEILTLDAQGNVLNRKTPATTDPNTNGLGTSFTPTVAWRAIPMPGGGAAFAHQLAADGTVTISEPGGYGDSGGGCDGTIVNSTVTIVTPSGDPTGGTQASGPAIVGASVPVDLATDGQGNLAIVSAGSETVFFTTAATVDPLQSFSPGCVSVGGVPVPGQAVAVDFYAANNVWIAQTREPATLAVMSANGISQTIELGGESRADTGHYLFHHNASDKTALACASCHPEGHEDNHVWVFDTLGKRRTQTVSGHVLETAPLHWNGDMDDLGMIMHEVFVNRMGGSPQGPRHVEAFGSWLNTIPAMPASTTANDTQISHGKELFERADVGCASCHSGSHFTNNQNQDVGTGRDFQVPTLVGVSSRAPFMHDGCAKTLKERFTNDASCTGGDKHGKISGLSASDLDDLVAYLETL